MLYNAEVFYKLFYCSACTSKTDSTMKGTCYAQSECASRGGTSGGNCAAGKMSEFLPINFINTKYPMHQNGLNYASLFRFQALEYAACSCKYF